MENISISWYHIPELVVPIRISLIEECCQQGIYWTNGFVWLSWSHYFECFTVATMTLLLPLWNICVTTDHGYVPHSWLITGLVTRLTRPVPLVEQKLLTLPMHMISPPVFSGVRVTRSLVLWVCFVDRCLFFSKVRVTRSLVLWVCFVDRCLFFSKVRVTRSLVLCLCFVDRCLF